MMEDEYDESYESGIFWCQPSNLGDSHLGSEAADEGPEVAAKPGIQDKKNQM